MAGKDLTALLSVDVDGLDDAGLLQYELDLEHAQRLIEAAKLAADAAVASRSLAQQRGYARTSVFLRDLLRISPHAACGRLRAAEALGPRRALTGEPLEPSYPTVAAAQLSGAISPEHARVVVQTVESLPEAVRAEHDRSVEQLLVAKALEFDPYTLKRVVAKRITDYLDPDGTLHTVEERHRRRYLRIHARPDGSSHVEGELTAECTELLLTLCDSLGKPASTSDVPDVRSRDQRCHDAVHEGMSRLVRSGGLPDIAGVTATVVLTMDADAYATGAGYATTGHGYRIPAAEARRWATADHDLIAVMLSRTKRVEAYSSRQRIFTSNQRLALWARDRGCTFPGCDIPAPWTEAHHVVDHADGGPTSIDNAALLCSYHDAHFEQLRWRCEMRDGTPVWIPPEWLDPDQAPRRNRQL